MIRLEHLPADVFGLSAQARAALSGHLRGDGPPVPRALEELTPPEERFVPAERAHLAKWLEARTADLRPHVHALESARALAQPGASVVVAGQQPGLLASPLLSLHKAVQAIALARALSERWGRPVVPLFWNHADDHDVAEANHVHVLTPHLDLQRIHLARSSSGRRPLSRLRFDDERHSLPAVRAMLAQTHGDHPHVEQALDLLMPRSGESFAGAFTRSLLGLLGHLGLLVVEPDWFRDEQSHALARLVGVDPLPKLQASTDALRAAGYEPGVELERPALVYRVDEDGRRALRPGGDGFRYDDEPGSRTCAELAAEIVQEPARWSAGALLRPIVQDLSLPVCAYVGGFGELAYHAQLPALRAAVEAPATPFVARVSATCIDEECELALVKAGATCAQVLAARGRFDPDPDRAQPPPAIEQLRERAQRAADELLALRPELDRIEPSLGPNLRRAVEQLRGAADKLARKAERAHANRAGTGRRHLRRLNNALCPKGLPQERVLGPFALLARHGFEWLDQLVAELDPFAVAHVAVHLYEDRTAGEGA